MDHLFFDHLMSVFFNSTSMWTFTILIDDIFYTHKIDASNDASTSFFSSFSLLFIFLWLLLLNCAMSDEWTLFFSALITAKRFLLSFSSALTIRRTLHWTFHKERLAQKDTWKLKFEAARFEPSILITFYHWIFFAGTGDWTRVCSLIMSLMDLL